MKKKIPSAIKIKKIKVLKKFIVKQINYKIIQFKNF